MKLRFWGVRGVHPSAGEAFVRYGGNTSALAIDLPDTTAGKGLRLLLDFGTGAIGVGRELLGAGFGAGQGQLAVLLTSTQLDHTGALPFFVPLFIPGNHITVLGIGTDHQSPRQLLEDLLNPHYSPINSLSNFSANLDIRAVESGEVQLAGLGPDQQISAMPLGGGPDTTLAWRVQAAGRKVALVGDAAWRSAAVQESVLAWAQGVDILIHNSAWIERLDPPVAGMCPKVQSVVDFALACGAGKLVLTHHSPYSTDAHLDMLQQRLDQLGGVPVIVAHEGLVLELGA